MRKSFVMNPQNFVWGGKEKVEGEEMLSLLLEQQEQHFFVHNQLTEEPPKVKKDELGDTIQRLQDEIEKIELETTNVSLRIEEDELTFHRDIRYILFDHLTKNHYNYSNFIGPVLSDITETSNQIGRYDLAGYLKGGSESVIRAGNSRKSNSLYAVKILSKTQMLTNFGILQRLENELKALNTMSYHPNIVEFREVLHAPTNIYIITELSRCNLLEYLNTNTFGITMKTTREIGIGILKALSHLHSYDLAHMDINMETIHVTGKIDISDLSQSHIKLGDFSCCKTRHINRENTSGFLSGNSVSQIRHGFTAPEIATAQPSADGCAADMWSFGVILLDIVKGLGNDWIDTYSDPANDKKRFEEELSLRVKELKAEIVVNSKFHHLLCNLLMMKPSGRFTASQALKHDWTNGKADHETSFKIFTKKRYTV